VAKKLSAGGRGPGQKPLAGRIPTRRAVLYIMYIMYKRRKGDPNPRWTMARNGFLGR